MWLMVCCGWHYSQGTQGNHQDQSERQACSTKWETCAPPPRHYPWTTPRWFGVSIDEMAMYCSHFYANSNTYPADGFEWHCKTASCTKVCAGGLSCAIRHCAWYVGGARGKVRSFTFTGDATYARIVVCCSRVVLWRRAASSSGDFAPSTQFVGAIHPSIGAAAGIVYCSCGASGRS